MWRFRGHTGVIRKGEARPLGNARMALAISDQVLVLNKGTMVFVGPTADFHRQEHDLKGRYLSV